jgi:PAS domain S-box-containing protein
MRIDIVPKDDPSSSSEETSRIVAAGYDTALVGTVIRHADPSSGYKKLLQSVYDAVLITDRNGRVVDFNTRATDFFRCSPEAIEGRRVTALISGGDDSLLAEIHRNLESHRYTLIEAYCLRRDRTTFAAEVAVNKIDLSESGQLCFFVRDITVRKRAQDALEDAVARLEEHDRAKSQFVSNVSHELRTPLTSMIYAISNLMRGVAGPVSEPVRRYLEVLDGDCQRLLRTVNDILDLRKIESKSMVLAKTKAPLAMLVRKTASSLSVLAERKAQTIDIDTAEDHWFVECDVHKIERVIVNVVNNSIKFTHDGGRIRVRVRDDEGGSGRALVAVTDNGVGIPAKDLCHVTERYYTVGDQPTGSGLGLAISKEIVEMHGGSLTVLSPPPGEKSGTEVRISLPVTLPPAVMIVHGDKEVRNRLALDLEGHGFRISRPERIETATAEVERVRPELVVTDVFLPGTEAMEFIFKIKSSKEISRIPIVVVASHPLDAVKRSVLANFSIPIISTPWRDTELSACVEGVFLG